LFEEGAVIACEVTQVEGSVFRVRYVASVADKITDENLREFWLDAKHISSISRHREKGNELGGWWHIVWMRSGEAHSFMSPPDDPSPLQPVIKVWTGR
jgi:hypothetical protein